MIVVGRLMVVRLSALFRLRGQEVKTSPFHGGNTGSIPVGVIFRLCSAYNIINKAQ